jgi:peptidyl-tRNA hydrolase
MFLTVNTDMIDELFSDIPTHIIFERWNDNGEDKIIVKYKIDREWGEREISPENVELLQKVLSGETLKTPNLINFGGC